MNSTPESAAWAAGSAPSRAQARDGLRSRPDSARSDLFDRVITMLEAMHGRQPSGKYFERYFGRGIRNAHHVMLLWKHDADRFAGGCERIHAEYRKYVETTTAER